VPILLCGVAVWMAFPRGGVIVGKTFARFFTPYAVARVFGGPVFWQCGAGVDLGGDVHHFQVGAGLTLTLANRVDVFFEGIPLGERALSGGVGVEW